MSERSVQAMKTMAVKHVDRMFIVVCGTEDPTDEEWEDYIKLVQHHAIDLTMQIVFTDGGEPSARQRQYLADVFAGRFVPVAFISDRLRIRVTVTIRSWFSRGIKWFPPSNVRDAMAYLGIPSSRMELVEHEVRRLRREVGRGTADG